MIKDNFLNNEIWISPLPFEQRLDLGRMCHVTINKQHGTITREFTITKPTVSGKVNPFGYTLDIVKAAFNNDLYWTRLLDSKYILKPIHVDENSLSMTFPYYGQDLYHDHKTFLSINNFREQIIEMYEYFKEVNIFKGNGSRSNLVLVNGNIKAFDFKWTAVRPKNIKLELMSYEIWLKNADTRLENDLKTISGLKGKTHNEFTFND
jgi:hypothetical protein